MLSYHLVRLPVFRLANRATFSSRFRLCTLSQPFPCRGSKRFIKADCQKRCHRTGLWLPERTSVRAPSISGPMWRRYALHRTWQPFLCCICCTFVSTWIWYFRIWNIQTSWGGFSNWCFCSSATPQRDLKPETRPELLLKVRLLESLSSKSSPLVGSKWMISLLFLNHASAALFFGLLPHLLKDSLTVRRRGTGELL